MMSVYFNSNMEDARIDMYIQLFKRDCFIGKAIEAAVPNCWGTFKWVSRETGRRLGGSTLCVYIDIIDIQLEALKRYRRGSRGPEEVSEMKLPQLTLWSDQLINAWRHTFCYPPSRFLPSTIHLFSVWSNLFSNVELHWLCVWIVSSVWLNLLQSDHLVIIACFAIEIIIHLNPSVGLSMSMPTHFCQLHLNLSDLHYFD